MSRIVVVFHSGYGHTQRLAEAIAKGAGAELLAIDAEGNLPETAWASLNAADAIIMGSPTYMGSVSWQFKKFADASNKGFGSDEGMDGSASELSTNRPNPNRCKHPSDGTWKFIVGVAFAYLVFCTARLIHQDNVDPASVSNRSFAPLAAWYSLLASLCLFVRWESWELPQKNRGKCLLLFGIGYLLFGFLLILLNGLF